MRHEPGKGAGVAIDIRPEVLIHRARPDVAAFMFDPANMLPFTNAPRLPNIGLMTTAGSAGIIDRNPALSCSVGFGICIQPTVLQRIRPTGHGRSAHLTVCRIASPPPGSAGPIPSPGFRPEAASFGRTSRTGWLR